MNSQQADVKWKRKLLWSVLFVLIAGASVYAVIAQSRTFSLSLFASYVANANPWYLAAAFLAMFGFIVFEGLSILLLCRAFGYRVSGVNACFYSASDIYFSAITPSATGGQPMCAYFMMKDGVRGVVTTISLLINLMVYTLSILVIGLFVFITHPSIFLKFSTFSKILILLGFTVQLGFAILFYLLLRREQLLHRLCRWGLRVLGKLHLIRNPEKKEERLVAIFEDYRQCTELMVGHKATVIKAFLLNLCQRASQIMVAVFCYLATGGELKRAFDLFATQSYAVLGSNSVPIPGAMGVSDYLMLDGFSAMGYDSAAATSLELLSRSISFYVCILLCGIAALIKFLLIKRRRDHQ